MKNKIILKKPTFNLFLPILFAILIVFSESAYGSIDYKLDKRSIDNNIDDNILNKFKPESHTTESYPHSLLGLGQVSVIISQSSTRSRRNQASSSSTKRSNNRSSASSRKITQKSPKKSKKKSKVREKFLTSEKSYTVKKGNRNTVIDFDETDITGERRDPNIGFVKSPILKGGNEFVQVRKQWHDTMISSTLLIE